MSEINGGCEIYAFMVVTYFFSSQHGLVRLYNNAKMFADT